MELLAECGSLWAGKSRQTGNNRRVRLLHFFIGNMLHFVFTKISQETVLQNEQCHLDITQSILGQTMACMLDLAFYVV